MQGTDSKPMSINPKSLALKKCDFYPKEGADGSFLGVGVVGDSTRISSLIE